MRAAVAASSVFGFHRAAALVLALDSTVSAIIDPRIDRSVVLLLKHCQKFSAVELYSKERTSFCESKSAISKHD